MFDATLKYTKCKSELLNDIDLLMFVEKAIRILVCSGRSSKYLPYTIGFLSVEDVENFDIMAVVDDADVGYSNQVDLEFPRERLHQCKDIPKLITKL